MRILMFCAFNFHHSGAPTKIFYQKNFSKRLTYPVCSSVVVFIVHFFMFVLVWQAT